MFQVYRFNPVLESAQTTKPRYCSTNVYTRNLVQNKRSRQTTCLKRAYRESVLVPRLWRDSLSSHLNATRIHGVILQKKKKTKQPFPEFFRAKFQVNSLPVWFSLYFLTHYGGVTEDRRPRPATS